MSLAPGGSPAPSITINKDYDAPVFRVVVTHREEPAGELIRRVNDYIDGHTKLVRAVWGPGTSVVVKVETPADLEECAGCGSYEDMERARWEHGEA